MGRKPDETIVTVDPRFIKARTRSTRGLLNGLLIGLLSRLFGVRT